MVNLSGYCYVLRLPLDILALAKAYPAYFRKEHTAVLDIKTLWIPKTIFRFAHLFEHGELFWVLLIKSFLYGFIKGFECLL